VTAAGDGRVRPAIVFLHGARLTGAEWAWQIAALSDEFVCLAPDLPGHGRAAGDVFTLESAAAGVADLIEAEAGGTAVVVGLSLGGYVAMDVAARWPNRVSGLVIADATMEPVWPQALLFEGLALAFDAVPERWLTRLNHVFFATRYPPAIAGPIVAGGFSFRAGAAAIRSLVGKRFIPRIAAFPGPTLIINGGLDPLFRLSAGSFARAAAAPRRVQLRGATHLSNLDRPSQFTAVVRAFAREATAPRPPA
jgi:pimeloyl-ACP methyl ester carboxylesterase